MSYIIIILFFCVIALFIAYPRIPRSSGSKCKNPDKNAEIISMETDLSGRKTTNAIATTTVKFSDGFIYISHKKKLYDAGFRRYVMCVDDEVREIIKEKAIKAHDKFILKFEKRETKKHI